MRFTYAATDNTGTNGVSLGAAGEDIRVYKLFVGAPVASGIVTLFNSAIAVGDASTNVAFRYTHGADVAPADTSFVEIRSFDFGPEGLPLDGGNLQIDEDMQVTVLWGKA